MNEVREYINKSLLTKGALMGIVVPQIDKFYVYRWATREEIRAEKNKTHNQTTEEEVDDEEEKVEEAPAENILVQPPPLEQADDNDTVMVDIGGEMIEMTRAQHREIML
jgi:hypothetical protein